jgi:hypothetical protein
MEKIKTDILAPKLKLYLLRAVGTFTVCVFAFWCCVGLSEWWAVAIEKKTNNHVFNGNPWYYENAQIYSKVMLIEGVVMLLLTACAIYFLVRRKRAIYLLLIVGICYSFARIIYGQAV